MSRIAYVNGRYLRHGDASVHIEDRGYQFGDGVYEVCEVRAGDLIDEIPHLDRLDRSLAELEMASPMPRAALRLVLRETVRRNRVVHGLVYLQVTRGVARRDHAFPKPGTRPAIVVTAKSINRDRLAGLAEKGVAVITCPDIRWTRVDVKSISLLPNCLAKQAARQRGAFEAWLIDRDGYVTEGASTNAWIVTEDDVLVTRQADQSILNGVTRRALADIAVSQGLKIEERPFTVAEALRGREAFVSASTLAAMPVISIDGVPVGSGKPGPIAQRLWQHVRDHDAVSVAAE
jgi:D-alanine transaminase